MIKTLFICYAVLLFLPVACQSPIDPAKQPDKEEIYNFFVDQLKQTAKASGYLGYGMVINGLSVDGPVKELSVPNIGNVTCFNIKINRTEYLDNYTGRYTSIFTNDYYQFYRDEYGHLAVASHIAGQTSTTMRPGPPASKFGE